MLDIQTSRGEGIMARPVIMPFLCFCHAALIDLDSANMLSDTYRCLNCGHIITHRQAVEEQIPFQWRGRPFREWGGSVDESRDRQKVT